MFVGKCVNLLAFVFSVTQRAVCDYEQPRSTDCTTGHTIACSYTYNAMCAKDAEGDEKREGEQVMDLIPSLVDKSTFQVVTPWVVTGGSDGKIDYDKLIEKV